MKNLKSKEVSSIKSKTLKVLFSMVLSTLFLLPLFSSAKVADKSKNTKVNIHPLRNNCQAAVSVASVEEGKFTLTIESKNGVDVYYDEIMKSTEYFAKVFDFSNLQAGEYILRMKAKNETNELRFSIVNGEVKVYSNERAAASFNLKGEKAFFSVPNASNQTYSIIIIDEKGNELYSAVENGTEIKKVFDFSTVGTGKYQILASSNGNTYAYDFEKKK